MHFLLMTGYVQMLTLRGGGRSIIKGGGGGGGGEAHIHIFLFTDCKNNGF